MSEFAAFLCASVCYGWANSLSKEFTVDRLHVD